MSLSLPSVEDLAEKWTLAHTVAVATWAVVIVLGIMLLVRNNASTYPVTDAVKVYAAENATFRYPANWTVNDCSSDKPFIELPGTIASDYKGQKRYPLGIYGTGAYSCVRGRPERLDISPEEIAASDNPCAPATSTQGEKLGNGLYLQLKEERDELVAIYIRQNSCFAPTDTVVLGFAFTDPKVQKDDITRFGVLLATADFVASPQYHDIRALAESIRY